MTTLIQSDLTQLSDLVLREARTAEVVEWQGRTALHLDGLALLSGYSFDNSRLEVWVGADKPCYPGLVFHAADLYNYEMAYAQPHTSGKWDALQYDPVFHGSNTWQIYQGSAYQAAAEVPTGRWFHLRVDCVDGRALVWLDGTPRLLVPHLAHEQRSGLAGIWTYLPAYFADLRISPLRALEDFPEAPVENVPGSAVDAWLLDGFGTVVCEPNASLNLNRYLSNSVHEAVLRRSFRLSTDATICVHAGFSDVLQLSLDGVEIFQGENRFHNEPEWNRRGYIGWTETVDVALSAGKHEISALLKQDEPYFGFGLRLALSGAEFEFLPVEIG